MKIIKNLTFATLAAMAVMVNPARAAEQPTLLYAIARPEPPGRS